MAGQPELAQLVDEHLDDYLSWFRDPAWHVMHAAGGRITGPRLGPRYVDTAYRVQTLLSATKKLADLQRFTGSETLIRSLENPRQVSSTLHEIEVAAWCAGRAIHRDLEFAPPVLKAGKIKHPEFGWETSLGLLFCECKQSQEWEHADLHRVRELATLAEASVDREAWPPDLRLDIVIDGGLGRNPEARLRAQLETVQTEVARGATPEPFRDGAFEFTVRPRTDEVPQPPDSVTSGTARGEPEGPASIGSLSPVTVTRSLARLRAQMVSKHVLDAKTQLPNEHPGAVFIDAGGVETAAARLEEIVRRPSTPNVVWGCIWSGGSPKTAVWQPGQPFDRRVVD